MTRATLAVAAWLILLIAVLATGYEENHLSCLRASGGRAALTQFLTDARRSRFAHAAVETGPVRIADLQEAKNVTYELMLVHALDCQALYPGTR